MFMFAFANGSIFVISNGFFPNCFILVNNSGHRPIFFFFAGTHRRLSCRPLLFVIPISFVIFSIYFSLVFSTRVCVCASARRVCVCICLWLIFSFLASAWLNFYLLGGTGDVIYAHYYKHKSIYSNDVCMLIKNKCHTKGSWTRCTLTDFVPVWLPACRLQHFCSRFRFGCWRWYF